MMKNIGIDARLWHESGVGRYIRNLVKGLDARNIRDVVFTIFLSPKAYDSVHFKSPNFRKVRSDISWHTISEQIRFKKQLDRENLDLAHFPYFSYPIFYRKPFVITIHDLIIDHYPTGVSSSLPLPFYYTKHFAYKKIIKSAVKNAQKIIVPSFATKAELVGHYKAKDSKVAVIYEGFDPLISENAFKEELVSKNYILYVGNAYPHKNLENLLKAYEILRKKMDIELICIGREDFFYKRLKKNQEGIHFLHGIDDSTLFSYYTNARLLVVPSLMEGFGLPLLEAMSLSCPVVSSDTPALAEIGGDAAFYMNPEEPKKIADAIEKVLKEPDLAEELTRKGLLQSKKFSWENCIEKTIEVYEGSISLRSGQ
jgi:glycosyltransferase involved in cell wall biosynthesis